MLTATDLKSIERRGMSKKQIEQQLKQFKNGLPVLKIVKPAVYRDGIKQLNEKDIEKYIKVYNKLSDNLVKVKFVPASGAATRMFKSLFELIQNYKGTESEYLEITSDKSFNSVNYLFQNIRNFAFYEDLVQVIEKNGMNINEIVRKNDFVILFKFLLEKQGLNYGNFPKALLKFHRSNSGNRTPVYEHLLEGVEYCNSAGNVLLHFTVSVEHLELIKSHVNEIAPALEKAFKVRFHVTYSIQNQATDTIAVDRANVPIRDENGELVFRPGGHGALIHNLNAIDADIIFIKNIDNVVQDRLKGDTYLYKQVLAGLLINTRQKAECYYQILEGEVTNDMLHEIEEFVHRKLCLGMPESFANWNKTKKTEFLKNKINRPMRVCGMVRNEGEPGGGPFWVVADDGSRNLQIVESSQFAAEQKGLLSHATHFNPVDIVCCTKNFSGNKYDLPNYIDENSGFISLKSIIGNEIKALELPGLWNGAMANWNTIFVEVPATTFNPVKTINDLLRCEHVFENDMQRIEVGFDNELS